MTSSEYSRLLDELAHSSPQASDPRIRLVLTKLLPQSREQLRSHTGGSSDFFRKIGTNLLRLRGFANDELRLELLFLCCEHLFLVGGVQEIQALGQGGVELATRTGRPAFLRKFHSILGVAASEMGDLARGIEHHAQALAISLEHGEVFGQYLAWSNLSASFVDSAMYREAVECASRALESIDPSDLAYSDFRARALNNTALALFQLGDHDRALDCSRASIRLSEDPKTQKAAIARLVRELNLVMILIEARNSAEARLHARYMDVLASTFPSQRARAAADLCIGLIEVFVGNASRGIELLEETASGLRGEMVPLYRDSLSILTRAYSELGRPEDALRVLQELVSHSSWERTTSLKTQLQSLGLGTESLQRRRRRNSREHERTEFELRARVAERELNRSRQEMLERMAVAADIREDISGEHGYRVGRLSALLAKEIGWERDACIAIDIAARLHDIGKIGIPEKILLDEKALREAEKHFIASHTRVGAEILSKSEIPQVRVAEEIALCHHEWWDGNGYPRQLKGTAIPKSARIVALADSFDAMTHGRPYAAAISIEAALDQISGLRGRQFDPELTDHFLALVRRLAAENADLDGYLGKSARNSPFLKARAKIKEMLAQGRESTALSPSPPPPGTALN